MCISRKPLKLNENRLSLFMNPFMQDFIQMICIEIAQSVCHLRNRLELWQKFVHKTLKTVKSYEYSHTTVSLDLNLRWITWIYFSKNNSNLKEKDIKTEFNRLFKRRVFWQFFGGFVFICWNYFQLFSNSRHKTLKTLICNELEKNVNLFLIKTNFKWIIPGSYSAQFTCPNKLLMTGLIEIL